jgi:tRNA(Ile)-lysidine synthase
MAQLGPFETAPHIAVAVSGGRDSMALVLLVAQWVQARNGSVLALTVDHGLRTDSCEEARRVASWMKGRGIPHKILSWDCPVHGAGLEAAARAARYQLLENLSREMGILHLCVGHHRGDQAETREMRRARNSGVIGLAGMAAVREMSHARVLRPLLTVPRDRITATLRDRGQDWVEDLSNYDPRFERARLRVNGTPTPFKDWLAGPGKRRVEHEGAVAALAARSVCVDPAGFVTIELTSFRSGDPHVSKSLLANVITCVSGGIYPPRGARLLRMWDLLAEEDIAQTRTLGGCVVRPAGQGCLRVTREIAAITATQSVAARSMFWDGRFRVVVNVPNASQFRIDALGKADAKHPDGTGHDDYARLACDVRAGLPALYKGEYLAARPEFSDSTSSSPPLLVQFSPQKPLAGAVFGNV